MTDFNPDPAVPVPALPETKLAPLFYVVSMRKFTILFLATLGLYEIYWFYKNWSLFKSRTPSASQFGTTIWPVPRAVFSVFFVHALFKKVREHAPDAAQVADWNASKHATILVLLIIGTNALSRVADHFHDNSLLNLLALLSLLPLMLSFRAAQDMINVACGDPHGASNAALSTANYVWIVLGGIFWEVILIGMIAMLFSGAEPGGGEPGW